MASDNTSQNQTIPSLSYPTILVLPNKHRQDEGIRMALDRLFDDLPSCIKSIRDTYEKPLEVQNDQYWQQKALESKYFETSVTTDITNYSDQYALTTPYNRAWKRVTKQIDIEAKLSCLEHKLVKYKDPAWKPKRCSRAQRNFRLHLSWIERTLMELRNDSILYDIWVQVAALDGEKCKKLVENALADDKLHSVGPRKFIRDILQDGKTFFPGASNDIREALKAEVAKYDLEPDLNDSSILPRHEGYFYAFESLVNDRRWIGSQAARLKRVQEGTKSEALEYLFKLNGQYSAVILEKARVPSYPTALFLPVDMHRNEEEELKFRARHNEALKGIENERDALFNQCRGEINLNSVLKFMKAISDRGIRHIDQHRENLANPTQAGSEAPPKVQLLMKAWERVKKQFQVEADFILLEQKFSLYTSDNSTVNKRSAKSSAKKVTQDTLSDRNTDIGKLREDKDLYAIWVQVGSIDQNTATECKKLILETLENEKLKDTEPRKFIKGLLKPEHALWSNMAAGHARIIRAALEAEVANYDLEPDSAGMNALDRLEGNFYAFESLVNDRKWILEQEEHLESLTKRHSETFRDNRKNHGSGSGSGSLSGTKRKPDDKHPGSATKPNKRKPKA